MTGNSNERLKLSKPVGRMPTLQFCRPAELQVDMAYQRDVGGADSQALIRRIAKAWNWDLCQPLTVSRRVADGAEAGLYVIDGQHRLEAARLRGDIDQLPCVIVTYGDAAEEAATFVKLNQQRRALNALELFRAAVRSGDSAATALLEAMRAEGLDLAPHGNPVAWKPGMVANVGGLRAAWGDHGPAVARAAMRVLARAWPGEVLRYAGTLFPGIVALCDDLAAETLDSGEIAKLTTFVGRTPQDEWRREIAAVKAENPGLRHSAASAMALRRAWRQARPVTVVVSAPPVAKPAPIKVASGVVSAKSAEPMGPRWCDQCDMRRWPAEVAACASAFCKLKVAR